MKNVVGRGKKTMKRKNKQTGAKAIKIFFLGTNGWYDTETGNTICILLDTEKAYIILDAGDGLYKADRYITDTKKPIYLFLSHFHLDHISGLHVLDKFKFPQGLTVCFSQGGKSILDAIIRQPYTIAFSDLGLQVNFKELVEGRPEGFPFGLAAKELKHSSKCFGYRFEVGNKTISFCTDTGYCDSALELSKDADLLIAECSLRHGQKSDGWPHLAPEDAARLAKEAGARKLALVHFDARNYKTLKERDETQAYAENIFKNVIAAKDGMTIEL